jgi:uncharacterized protein (TIGR00255 family)
MTGFGEHRFSIGALRGRIEIRSINHRYFDFSSRLPLLVSPLEQKIKDFLSQYLVRGKVTLSISLNSQNGMDPVLIDTDKLKFYKKELQKAAKKVGFKADLSVSDVIRLPNVFTVESKEQDPEKLWKKLQPELKKAIIRVIHMQEKEGSALVEDILARLSKIETNSRKIETLSQEMVPAFKEKLEKKISELTSSSQLDSNRLEQEVALFAQHHDITEELVRLRSHMGIFKKILAHEREVGKKLDFLIQEMNREVNTISSKALSSEISQSVVEIKTEQEKIREQIQNIE